MMQLSDALQKGRVLILPRRGGEYFPDGSGCARGIALEAVGARLKVNNEYLPPTSNLTVFATTWPWTQQQKFSAPCSCFQRVPLLSLTASRLIQHLFDRHVVEAAPCLVSGLPYDEEGERQLKDWTFDQLVAWVKSIEPAVAS